MSFPVLEILAQMSTFFVYNGTKLHSKVHFYIYKLISIVCSDIITQLLKCKDYIIMGSLMDKW